MKFKKKLNILFTVHNSDRQWLLF